MGKPIKHFGKRRIRYTDEAGRRRSKTFTEKKAAELVLKQSEILVEERKKGLRPIEIEPKTFLDASAYWRENRAPHKRSCKDDLSIIKQLDAHFGNQRLNDHGQWVVEIDRYSALKAKLNKKTLANHLTLLGSILRLAHDLGWCERVPKIHKPRTGRPLAQADSRGPPRQTPRANKLDFSARATSAPSPQAQLDWPSPRRPVGRP